MYIIESPIHSYVENTVPPMWLRRPKLTLKSDEGNPFNKTEYTIQRHYLNKANNIESFVFTYDDQAILLMQEYSILHFNVLHKQTQTSPSLKTTIKGLFSIKPCICNSKNVTNELSRH